MPSQTPPSQCPLHESMSGLSTAFLTQLFAYHHAGRLTRSRIMYAMEPFPPPPVHTISACLRDMVLLGKSSTTFTDFRLLPRTVASLSKWRGGKLQLQVAKKGQMLYRGVTVVGNGRLPMRLQRESWAVYMYCTVQYSAVQWANFGVRMMICSVGFKQACAEGGVGCSARETHQVFCCELIALPGGRKCAASRTRLQF